MDCAADQSGSIKRCLPREAEAIDFAAQLETSHRVLWVLAAGLAGRRELADDLVQDAVVAALGKLDQFTVDTNFTAWMAQIVRYTAMNRRRSERRRQMVSLEQAPIDSSAPTQRSEYNDDFESFHQNSRLPQDQPYFDDELTAGLNELSDVARACLLLRTVTELPYEQIARLLDIPQGTAMSHVHRSRQFLRQRLGQSNATSAKGKGLDQ